MDVKLSFDSVPFGDGPSSSRGGPHLIVPFPGEFQGRFSISGRKTVVRVTVNVAEVELTEAVLVELETPLLFFIDEVLVPHLHPGDPPAAEKRCCLFLFATAAPLSCDRRGVRVSPGSNVSLCASRAASKR